MVSSVTKLEAALSCWRVCWDRQGLHEEPRADRRADNWWYLMLLLVGVGDDDVVVVVVVVVAGPGPQ